MPDPTLWEGFLCRGWLGLAPDKEATRTKPSRSVSPQDFGARHPPLCPISSPACLSQQNPTNGSTLISSDLLKQEEIHPLHHQCLHRICTTHGAPQQRGCHYGCCHLQPLEVLNWSPCERNHRPGERILRWYLLRSVGKIGDYTLENDCRAPQCNSRAEVANKPIWDNWEPYLYPVMFSHNTSFHRSVQNSPICVVSPKVANASTVSCCCVAVASSIVWPLPM